jgi:hypothetical protein
MRFVSLSLVLFLPLHAAVIGTSKPAEPLTAARINATLPASQRGPWLAYLKRSEEQMAADRRALAAEREGMASFPGPATERGSAQSVPLHRGTEFYRSDTARHIGDTILSFQTPAGGWSKNIDMAGAPRAKGQGYTSNNLSQHLGVDDFDAPRDPQWNYVGTLDNDATNTELHFLAGLSAAFPGKDGDGYRASFLRGVEYLLRAQYPNGGWPQVWPLEGGYHDAITFNDDAVTESAELLTLVAAGEKYTSEPDADEIEAARVLAAKSGADAAPVPQKSVEDYTFVPAALRTRAKAAAAHALEIILAGSCVHQLRTAKERC